MRLQDYWEKEARHKQCIPTARWEQFRVVSAGNSINGHGQPVLTSNAQDLDKVSR